MYCGCDLSLTLRLFLGLPGRGSLGWEPGLRLLAPLLLAQKWSVLHQARREPYIRPGGKLAGRETFWADRSRSASTSASRTSPPLPRPPPSRSPPPASHSTYSYADGLQSPCCGLPRGAVAWGQQIGQHRLWITTMGELCIMVEI